MHNTSRDFLTLFNGYRKKRKIVKDKRNSMAQWINLHRNNSFLNRTRLPLLCEKSGAILLVLVGLTPGRLAGRQPDEIREDLKIFEILY